MALGLFLVPRRERGKVLERDQRFARPQARSKAAGGLRPADLPPLVALDAELRGIPRPFVDAIRAGVNPLESEPSCDARSGEDVTDGRVTPLTAMRSPNDG